MDEKERQIRNRLNIPMNSDVTIIDLDEQQKPPEPITAGWTDTQISNKTVLEIEGLIKQNELALESIEQTLMKQRQQISDLRQVRQRKLLIGGS